MDGNEALKKWQHRLRLDDWTIKLCDNCKPDEMSIENVDGCVDWRECNKTARIEILDESYYGDRVVPYDHTRILLHELLHLKFCLLSSNSDDLRSRVVHQIIDDIAKALAETERENKYDEGSGV